MYVKFLGLLNIYTLYVLQKVSRASDNTLKNEASCYLSSVNCVLT